MKLIHISEISPACPGERMGDIDPHRRLGQLLTHARGSNGDADRTITCDLTHWGAPAACQTRKDALVDLSCPVRLLVGNHDDHANFLSVLPDHPKDEIGFINHAESLGDIRLICLDIAAPRTHAGHFVTDRIAWLEAELKDCARACSFMHQNAMELGWSAEDRIAIVDASRPAFADLLTHCRDRIECMHFGHVHAVAHRTCCGIPLASVRSASMQGIPDFTEPDLLLGAPMALSCAVVLFKDGTTVIYGIPFTWDSPAFTCGTSREDWAKPVAPE